MGVQLPPPVNLPVMIGHVESMVVRPPSKELHLGRGEPGKVLWQDLGQIHQQASESHGPSKKKKIKINLIPRASLWCE